MKKRKKIKSEYEAIKKQAGKNRRRGKRNEKNLCKLLGFERVGIFGGEDAKCGPISAEFKDRKTYAGHNMFYGQTEVNRKKAKRKLGLLIVHISGKRRKDDLVHMRLEDFLEMFECSKKGGYLKRLEKK